MWYIIWGMTGREEELIDRIKELVPKELYGDVWTPYKLVISKFHGEEVRRRVMMFPGYVFIDTDNADKIHALMSGKKDYIGFVKFDDEFIPVSDTDRQIIEFFVSDKGVAGISLGIRENGRTRILDGPLKGMDDKIVKINRNKKKAWVSLKNFLGEDRELSFALEIVEKGEL